MKVLVLGASGMLGSAVLSVLSERPGIDAVGAVRSEAAIPLFPAALQARIRPGIDAERVETMAALLEAERPDVVVNAIGVIKQRDAASDVLAAAPINTLLPHHLAAFCQKIGARIVHVSTDCVFSGDKGGYLEDDVADARDTYGLTKYLGELREGPALTLRTSIIGPELRPGGVSLLDWFLAQTGAVRGFRRAVFSGVPTVEFGRILADSVLPRPDLTGLYHLAAAPISKHELLTLIRDAYAKDIEIAPVDAPVIDRSLNAERFNRATGYAPPAWPDLVAAMRAADRRPPLPERS